MPSPLICIQCDRKIPREGETGWYNSAVCKCPAPKAFDTNTGRVVTFDDRVPGGLGSMGRRGIGLFPTAETDSDTESDAEEWESSLGLGANVSGF